MPPRLHSLFQRLSQATTERDLRNTLMDNLNRHFEVQRWGLYLSQNNGELLSSDVVGVSDRFVAKYNAMGKAVDPVLKYVLDYHAPAHEELVLPSGQWKQSKLYRYCCREYDHEHIMTGPIVGNGNLIGTIHFARVNDSRSFDYQDLAKLSGVCLHVSACLSKLRSERVSELERSHLLTPREMQIATLVARGMTNAEIGKELWISQNTVKQGLKKMFVKLDVRSRTAMTYKLRSNLDC